MKRTVMLLLVCMALLVGCEQPVVNKIEPFPLLGLTGEWVLTMDNETQSGLSLVQADDLTIRGAFDPYFRHSETILLYGIQYPNSRYFDIQGEWGPYTVYFHCVGLPPNRFDGQMDIVEPNSKSIMYSVTFYAVRDDSTLGAVAAQ